MPSENLLVVDDDQAFLDLMVHHLRRKGYQVESALDGKEALHILQSKGPFTILVTDLMMPGMSGLELLRLARKVDPTIEVIVITAAPSLEMAISAMREDGAFDYLTKPLDMMGELSLAVERAADHRRMKIEREDLRESLILGADQLKLVLTNTTTSILAVDESGKIILASANIIGDSMQDSPEQSLETTDVPPPLLDLVSQWTDLGCPSSATVDFHWRENEVQRMNISPIPSGECASGGWVLMLHDATSQKRIEDFVIDRIINLGKRIRSPMLAATSILSELQNLSSVNGSKVYEKVDAIKRCIDRVMSSSEDLNVFDSQIQIEKNTKVPLSEFIHREEERRVNEFGVVNQFSIKWDLKNDLPHVKIDLQLMYQILQHLSHWASNIPDRSDAVMVTCWTRSDRIWFRVYASEQGQKPAQDEHVREDPLEMIWRMERSEIHLAFAKSIIGKLNGHLWTWVDENQGTNVAFYVPSG